MEADRPAFTGYRQTYRNRAEALELLIHAKQWPVSQGKFYPDCLKYGLVQTDRSITLADLLNYVEQKLKIDPVTGQSLLEVDHGKEIAALELKERRLKVEKLERDGIKDSKEYLKRETVNEREGALVGQILGELRFQLGKAVPAVLAISKGDSERKGDVARLLEETVFGAFRAIYEAGEVDITFEDEME